METLDLSGTWEIVERPLGDGVEQACDVLAAPASLTGQVPGDVNDSLVQAGREPEPLVGLNHRRFRWVQQRSWWYRRSVHVPAEWAHRAAVELSLDGLDVHADIWINGQHLGHQASAFYPFEREVKRHLRFGQDNTILVRLTTGREVMSRYADRHWCQGVPTEAERGYPDRGTGERIYLRKPAYVWGWDWGPQLATCGITGKAMLRAAGPAEIRDVQAVTELRGPDAVVRVGVELDFIARIASSRADVTVRLTDQDGREFSATRANVFIAGGTNYIDLTVEVPQARLWWPNGSGQPHLYTLRAEACLEGVKVESAPRRVGLRTIEMDTSPGRFGFIVNGVPLFLKGGNWIPSDSLYGRLTDEKLTRLVDEAVEANFNVLRIWGGGRYEADAFYDACDARGLLLWHDFMSACAPLPADEDWFTREFAAEAQFQIRRLRGRASLMLWCGNNEVSACYSWKPYLYEPQWDPAWQLYHRLLPALIRQLCPHIPYRPTSPYGGPKTVQDPREGDDHHWVTMRKDSQFWSDPWYWDGAEVPIFNSEYGYGGPCCIESTRQYLGTAQPDLAGEVGHDHTNTFYDIPRVNFSIAAHYRDVEGLSLEDYILLGGLCQGLNLGYSLESLRANGHTQGGIFWMFNDTWGENGWSIVDYYLRRKVSYYNVRRSLSPRRLTLRRGGKAFGGREDEVLLIALNDGPEAVETSCRLGYMRYDGQDAELRDVAVRVEPRSHRVIARVGVPGEPQLAGGTIVAIPAGAGFDAAWWQRGPFRRLNVPQTRLRIVDTRADGPDLAVTVSAEGFAHAVHLDLGGDWRLSDHYFDLLPGQSRTVRVFGGAALAGRSLRVQAVNA